jgi:hypothetical protein
VEVGDEMKKAKKFSLFTALLLTCISFAACGKSSAKDFRKGKTGQEAYLATVKGFLYELGQNNDSAVEKYCSELFYQDNFLTEKNGEKVIGLTSVKEKSLALKNKEPDQSYIVEASYSAKYTKAAPYYKDSDTSYDLDSFFKVKKIKGEYKITGKADSIEDLENTVPNNAIHTISLKDKEAQKAKSTVDQFFDAFGKGNFSKLEDYTLDEFFQDSVLGAKYKDEFLGMYTGKLVHVSNDVTQLGEDRFSFLIDVKAKVSKHSPDYLGNDKPVEFTTAIKVVKINGKYVVASLFEF